MIPVLPLLKPVWTFLRNVSWKVWAGIAAFLFVLWLRSHWIGVGEDRVRGEFDAYKAEMVAKTEAARVAAKRAESAQAGAIQAALEAYKKDHEHAQDTGKAVTAGLNTGTLKLREHWQGCPQRVPAAAGNTQGSDAADRLRKESAGRVIAIGADADAKVKALEAIILSAPHCFVVK
mgnify:CR=1 FL=1